MIRQIKNGAVTRGALVDTIASLRAAASLQASPMAASASLLGALAKDHFPRRHFAKGFLIKQPGDQAGSIYLIETGRVASFFVGPQGHDVPFLELGPGHFIGTQSAFGSDEPPTYFEAVADTFALVLSRGQFLEALSNKPEFAESLIRLMNCGLQAMKQLYIESRLLPMKARLYAELIRLGASGGGSRISPAPTHADLARKIASQRETVTKEMKILARMGVIDSSRELVVIKDEAYLLSEINKSLGLVDD